MSLEYICFFSDNDKFVNLNQKNIFQRELDAKINIVSKAGHFSNLSGYDTFQLLVDEVYRLTNKDSYSRNI